MNRRKKILACALALALGASGAFAAGPVLTLNKILPPKYPDVLQARDVAVLPFTGPEAEELTALIEGVVAAAGSEGNRLYRVSDRSSFDKRYKEIERSQKGEVAHEKQILKLGRAIGATALYTGSVEKPDLSKSQTRGTRQVCAQRDTRNNASAILGTNCKQWKEQAVTCYKRVATYAFNAKLMMVEDGRVIMSERFESSMVADTCGKGQEQAAEVSNEQLVQAAREGALANLRAAITPNAVKLKVEMFPADSKIPDRAMRTAYENGLAFAKEKRMDRACEIWNQAAQGSEPPLQILYALGVCKEAEGDLAGAYVLYNKADRMLSRPDKKLSSALERTRQQT